MGPSLNAIKEFEPLPAELAPVIDWSD
jgi:hypothetical protein